MSRKDSPLLAIFSASSKQNGPKTLPANKLHQIVNMANGSKKAMAMVISKEPVRYNLEVEGNVIQHVMEFRYLGIDISNAMTKYNEVREN